MCKQRLELQKDADDLKDVLPGYGFEGNRKGFHFISFRSPLLQGVREMVCHCAPYLQELCEGRFRAGREDFEVRSLFDSINMHLIYLVSSNSWCMHMPNAL